MGIFGQSRLHVREQSVAGSSPKFALPLRADGCSPLVIDPVPPVAATSPLFGARNLVRSFWLERLHSIPILAVREVSLSGDSAIRQKEFAGGANNRR